MADNDAVEFLALLRPGGPWVLSAIEPDGKIETITAKTDGDVRAFVSKYNGARNLYYSVNPTRKAMTSKAAKTDIAAIEYLLGDLDPKPGETSEAAKARYLAALDELKPAPTAIIDSGNGIQVLLKLAQPIELAEPVIERGEESLSRGDGGADRRHREPRQDLDGNAGQRRGHPEHRPHPAPARHDQLAEREEATRRPHRMPDQADQLQRRDMQVGGFSCAGAIAARR